MQQAAEAARLSEERKRQTPAARAFDRWPEELSHAQESLFSQVARYFLFSLFHARYEIPLFDLTYTLLIFIYHSIYHYFYDLFSAYTIPYDY